MAKWVNGYGGGSDGRPLYDDLHIIQDNETGQHTVGSGPGGCYCEPTVIDIFKVGNLVRRVILHQALANTEAFYRDYERRKDADRRRL